MCRGHIEGAVGVLPLPVGEGRGEGAVFKALSPPAPPTKRSTEHPVVRDRFFPRWKYRTERTGIRIYYRTAEQGEAVHELVSPPGRLDKTGEQHSGNGTAHGNQRESAPGFEHIRAAGPNQHPLPGHPADEDQKEYVP